jgi:hypothetical protein
MQIPPKLATRSTQKPYHSFHLIPCQLFQSKVGHSHTSIPIAKDSAGSGEWPVFGEQVDSTLPRFGQKRKFVFAGKLMLKWLFHSESCQMLNSCYSALWKAFHKADYA